MSNSEFFVDPMIYDGAVYDAINTFDYDLAFYQKWAKAANGPVLELCCGTGRLTIPLAQAGIAMTGLDDAESMLVQARKKAEQNNASIEFVTADMRDFSLDRVFPLILIPFNSLQGIYNLNDLEAVFACVRRHLTPAGLLIFDLFNPDFRLMLSRAEKPHFLGKYQLGQDCSMVIHDRCTYDALSQVNRAEWIIEIEGDVSVRHLDVRCYYPQEMLALLKYNGFEVIHHFGDFDEAPFRSNSAKQIFVCQVK